jgi:hypothetical protein
MEKVICDLGWMNDTQGPVDAMVIAAVVGLIVGTICFGVLALSLWFTRSYRQARNPIVLGLLYLLFAPLGIGSLLFLRALNESLGIVRQSTAYYAELYCYASAGAVVVFFAIRAEMRWRRSIGLGPNSY